MTMAARFTFSSFIIFTITMTNIVNSLQREEKNFKPAEVLIIENELLKSSETINPNGLFKIPETPTALHEGNVYIDPKFILHSPFVSFTQEYKADGCCDNIYNLSNRPTEETGIEIRKPQSPQVPSGVSPPIILAPKIGAVFSIPPQRYPNTIPSLQNDLQLPIHLFKCDNILNIPMPCMPLILTSRYEKDLPKFSTSVENFVHPIEIPKPPVLPPIILPKLPIEVKIQKSILSNPPSFVQIPDQPIYVPALCPPMVKCISAERNFPSASDIVKIIYDKFMNILSVSNRIDFANLNILVPDEITLVSNPPLLFPTSCARSIIAERVVPNIIRNYVFTE